MSELEAMRRRHHTQRLAFLLAWLIVIPAFYVLYLITKP